MFRGTSMPKTGRKPAGVIRTDDLVIDRDGVVWRVHSVEHAARAVVLTVRNQVGEKGLVGVPYDHEFTVPAAPMSQSARALLRGLPWWVAAVLVALVALVAGAPLNGGALFAIVVLWMAGAVVMVTTPERVR